MSEPKAEGGERKQYKQGIEERKQGRAEIQEQRTVVLANEQWKKAVWKLKFEKELSLQVTKPDSS